MFLGMSRLTFFWGGQRCKNLFVCVGKKISYVKSKLQTLHI